MSRSPFAAYTQGKVLRLSPSPRMMALISSKTWRCHVSSANLLSTWSLISVLAGCVKLGRDYLHSQKVIGTMTGLRGSRSFELDALALQLKCFEDILHVLDSLRQVCASCLGSETSQYGYGEAQKEDDDIQGELHCGDGCRGYANKVSKWTTEC